MKITVNNIQLELHNGARVKDAVLKYYSQKGQPIPKPFPTVEDRYGNTVDSDGELTEGDTLIINEERKKSFSLPLLLLAALASMLLCSFCYGKKIITGKDGEKQAVIFAVNDMHAAIDNFPKLAYVVDSLRAIYPDMLLVSAGDNQTGNPVNDQCPEKGLPMIELMNAVDFNLSAVGNHEFDSRQKGFASLTHKAQFEFLCANVIPNDSLGMKLSPYKIITLPNGLRLAFFSLLQINQNGIPDTHPDNTKGFTFLDPFKTAKEYMFLKEKCNILIALTHIGFESDVMLADSMPAGIDLIIGGHSHTLVKKEQVHNGILITQAGSKLKYGTLITLTVNSDGSLKRSMQLIDIKDSKNEKPAIRAMVDKYNDNPALKQVIATATDNFTRYEELGYLMADAQRDAAKADIALVNPGGVRIDNLPKGPVTVMNVYQLDPFGNELVLTRLTGNEIHALMVAAFSIDDRDALYVSGIRTKVTTDANHNLTGILLLNDDGTPLDLGKTYSVAMNNYMTQVYKYQHADPGQSLFITTADATIQYLKKIQNIKSYKGEKRVQIN
jgi:5'-nucleotidase / UDP-sugar diphosphatase